MTDGDAGLLGRALDQLAGLLDDVPAEALDRATPCADWTVRDLVDHVVAAPVRFAQMARGESVDWTATPAAGEDPAGAFRANAQELMGAAGDQGVPIDWQCAELAVHTWDLATALGRPTGDLDPKVAERGLTFMRANLTADNRAPAFDAERPAPRGADAYQQIAAFAGRRL